MKPQGTFDSLGPKICVGVNVRVDKVILLFPSFFLLRLSEICVGHTAGSYRMLNIQAAITSFKSKDILHCWDLVQRCQLKYEKYLDDAQFYIFLPY